MRARLPTLHLTMIAWTTYTSTNVSQTDVSEARLNHNAQWRTRSPRFPSRVPSLRFSTLRFRDHSGQQTHEPILTSHLASDVLHDQGRSPTAIRSWNYPSHVRKHRFSIESPLGQKHLSEYVMHSLTELDSCEVSSKNIAATLSSAKVRSW